MLRQWSRETLKQDVNSTHLSQLVPVLLHRPLSQNMIRALKTDTRLEGGSVQDHILP